MNQLDAIQQIETDFEEGNGPFENVEFPESRLVREIKVQAGSKENPASFNMEERLQVISIFSTLDYNRNANQLVDKLIELHKVCPQMFNPKKVHSKKEVEQAFDTVSFRYPNRDARNWYKNCQILRDNYDGNWHELLLSVSCNAPELVDRLNDDDFNALKGKKIAPMYARIINDEVAPLDGLWELDIPVDTHIARLTEKLTETEMSNDDVRAWWQVIGEQGDISRHIVDGAMWLIGNNWKDWGQEYFTEVTGTEEFEYL